MSCSGETMEAENEFVQIKPMIQSQLKKAKYGVSDHGTVELCHWTKKSFKDNGDCYKHKFYGISTHRCMEFSPAGMFCENRCVYCWRPMEFYSAMKMPAENVAPPEIIVSNLMEERSKLIMGHYGDPKSNKKRLDESLLPSHYAISLSGEPTMYPKLPELIKYLKNLPSTKSIFLVTNGQEPDMLERLRDEDALPTQLYLSTNAPNQQIFDLVNKPKYKDAWKRWNKSLDLLANLNTRTVLRFTLIRHYNADDKLIPEYAELVNRANVHFIETKSYMHVGRSTNRLEYSNSPSMSDIRIFAKGLSRESKIYSIMDESEISRIVVLQNKKRFIDRWITSYADTN